MYKRMIINIILPPTLTVTYVNLLGQKRSPTKPKGYCLSKHLVVWYIS